jgi:hypothetical protein
MTKDVIVHLFIKINSSCKLFQGIPLNYTSEFLELFEDTTYIYECHNLQNKNKIISLNTSQISAFVTVIRPVFCEIQHLPNTKPKLNYIRYKKLKFFSS